MAAADRITLYLDTVYKHTARIYIAVDTAEVAHASEIANDNIIAARLAMMSNDAGESCRVAVAVAAQQLHSALLTRLIHPPKPPRFDARLDPNGSSFGSDP